jgi:hypothetical protein
MAGRGPDIALLSRTSNPQLTSLFFTRLPIEIRNLIYLEFWNLSSSRLHIHAEEVQLPRTVVPSVDPRSRRLRWSHTRCIADPRAPDARIDGCSRARYGSDEHALWTARVRSECGFHWPCQEARDRKEALALPEKGSSGNRNVPNQELSELRVLGGAFSLMS